MSPILANDSILAADTGRETPSDTGGRYWQKRSGFDTGRRSAPRYWRPILATLAILAAALLACSAPAWAPTQAPAAILAETPRPSPTEGKVSVSIPSPSEIRETVTAIEALNVRAEPGEWSAGLGVLLSGDPVVLSGKCSTDPAGWAQIQYKNRLAWVKARYISGDRCKEE